MIHVHEEPETIKCAFGRAMEACEFCGTLTRFWTMDAHHSVCPDCALTHELIDLRKIQQLSPVFPTKEAFCAAYGNGAEAKVFSLSSPRSLNINGQEAMLQAGDPVIGFLWKSYERDDQGNYNVYRVPGVGFISDSE